MFPPLAFGLTHISESKIDSFVSYMYLVWQGPSGKQKYANKYNHVPASTKQINMTTTVKYKQTYKKLIFSFLC